MVVVEEEEGGSVVAIHRSGAKSDDAIALEMLWRETPPSPSRRFSDENAACATPAPTHAPTRSAASAAASDAGVGRASIARPTGGR